MPTEDRQPYGLVTPALSRTAPIEAHIDRAIQELFASFPNPDRLSPAEQCAVIARYTAVLEGNFIYWMTAAYLSVGSAEAHAIIRDNLLEEVRDNHPGMLRRFAMAAHAVPTDRDAVAVSRHLQSVREFVGCLSGAKIVIMMAFFEGFIQRFMPYLAELARRQGSTETQYTDVHGLCDLVHTEQLFHAVEADLALLDGQRPSTAALLEGVGLLTALIETIVHGAEAR
jgi:hypothetical protein